MSRARDLANFASDSQINAGEIEDNAVTTAKIADSAITVAKIGDGAVHNVKLANSTIIMSGDSGTDSVALGETMTVAGGTGIDTTGSSNTITIDIDSTVATLTGTQTLTNKTINSASNTITITESNISDLGSYIENVVEDTTPQLGGDLDTNGNDINFGDNDKAQFGTSNDLAIYHDGSQSTIEDVGTGQLKILAENTLHFGSATGTEKYIRALKNGQVELYHDNSKKFETTSGGIDVTGTITFDGGTTTADLNFGDNDKAVFGAGSDLQIYHDSTGDIGGVAGSFIEDTGTGDLFIRGSNDIQFQTASQEKLARFSENGAVTLFYDDNAKLDTTSTGIDVTGTITFDGGTTSADLNFGDNDKAVFGAGSDLEIYHDSGHSYVADVGNGSLKVRGTNLILENSDGSKRYAYLLDGGKAELYYNNSAKLETTSTGIDVTGSGTFSGNGSLNNNDTAIGLDVSGTNHVKQRITTPTAGGYQASLELESNSVPISIATTGSNDIRFISNSFEKMKILPDEVVMNEQSYDQDFRVESNNNTHAFFVDGGNDKVGILTSSQPNNLASNFFVDGITSIESATTATLYMARNTTATDGDVAGDIHFIATESTGANTNRTMARIKAVAVGSPNTQQPAALEFTTQQAAGSSSQHYRRMRIDYNGDISFYEDTGATAKLFWDASAERLLIGATSASNLNTYGDDLIVSNTTSGTGSGISIISNATNGYSNVFFGDTDDGDIGRIQYNNTNNSMTFRTNASDALFIDSSGNVGIGTTDPQTSLTVGDGTGSPQVLIWGSNSNSNSGRLTFAGQDPYTNEFIQFRYDSGPNVLHLETESVFGVGNIMSIGRQFGDITINDNGNSSADFRVESDSNTHALFVDTSGDDVCFFKSAIGDTVVGFDIRDNGNLTAIVNNASRVIKINNQGGNTYNPLEFFSVNAGKGSITTDSVGTTYNTTSDYRLKDNIEMITDGTERLMKLKPVRHSWKEQPDITVDGFLAHEVQESGLEYAVTGEKDGKEMQSMDYGRITPVIVSALQDAIKEINSLKQRIKELESK